LLIQETNDIAGQVPGGVPAYAPLPLSIMTCVAIETLAQILFGDSSNKDDKGHGFKKVLGKMSSKLSKKLGKQDIGDLENRWGTETEKAACVSDLIYTFFRNTLIHGFRGRVVYIGGYSEVADAELRAGALGLNPFWFWESYKNTFEKQFDQLLAEKQSGERTKCLVYLAKLLG